MALTIEAASSMRARTGVTPSVRDPSDEEYERFRYWSGGDFDPEWFDLVERNIALQKIAMR